MHVRFPACNHTSSCKARVAPPETDLQDSLPVDANDNTPNRLEGILDGVTWPQPRAVNNKDNEMFVSPFR
jgi:hypothetical protein